MGGWHKISNKLAEDALMPQPSIWSEKRPCPFEHACLELSLLAARGDAARWSVLRLSKRWGVSRRMARKVLEVVEADAKENGFPWADTFRTSDRTSDRTEESEERREDTNKSEHDSDTKRTGFGHNLGTHARSMSSDLRSKKGEGTPLPGEESSEARDKSNEVGAAQNLQAAVVDKGGRATCTGAPHAPPQGEVERAPREIPPQGTSQIFPGVGRPKLSRGRGGANLSEFGARKPGQPSGPAEKPPPHVVMREGGYPVKEEDGWYEVYFIGGKECRRICREDGL